MTQATESSMSTPETYETVCYGCAPQKPFERFTVKRNVCGPNDVEFDVLYCGICHSDIHAADGDLGVAPVPLLAPGHELSGVVTKVGANVKDVKVGEFVGVGCMVESCKKCKQCKIGHENYCKEGCVMTYADVPKFGTLYCDSGITQGGYTERMTVNRDFLVKVPSSYPLDKAGPLLCSAITLYTPLKKYGALKGGMTIGIVGIGGLGTMGIQLAKAMGNKVVAISRNDAKKDFALKELGCDGFISRENKDDVAKAADSLDLIINTVTAKTDTLDLMTMITSGARVVVLGLIVQPLDFHGLHSLKDKGIVGSFIGGVPDTQEVVDYCDKHKIYPITEKITANKIDEVYEKLRNGNDAGIRYVLDLKASKDVKM